MGQSEKKFQMFVYKLIQSKNKSLGIGTCTLHHSVNMPLAGPRHSVEKKLIRTANRFCFIASEYSLFFLLKQLHRLKHSSTQAVGRVN
jgi:hypothetical protein